MATVNESPPPFIQILHLGLLMPSSSPSCTPLPYLSKWPTSSVCTFSLPHKNCSHTLHSSSSECSQTISQCSSSPIPPLHTLFPLHMFPCHISHMYLHFSHCSILSLHIAPSHSPWVASHFIALFIYIFLCLSIYSSICFYLCHFNFLIPLSEGVQRAGV